MNMHALMQPETNLKLYGRVLSGLEPDTHVSVGGVGFGLLG